MNEELSIKSASELLGEVNDFLARLPYDRQPSSLYEPVKYVLSMGGKRMRPVLMLLAYNLYKDDPESILMQAVGLEERLSSSSTSMVTASLPDLSV